MRSVMVYSPAPATSTTTPAPASPNGTMIRCSKMPSGTTPSVSPARTLSPAATRGVNSHTWSRGRACVCSPRGRKNPWLAAMTLSGFWRPSNTCESSPGASSTESSSPTNSTASPTLMPAVLSNTCMSAYRPLTRMTSAMSRRSSCRT